jgi:hypothetical protein
MIDERGVRLGENNPLIRHRFLRLVRFAKMARADVRNLTHDNNKGYRNKIPITRITPWRGGGPA